MSVKTNSYSVIANQKCSWLLNVSYSKPSV